MRKFPRGRKGGLESEPHRLLSLRRRPPGRDNNDFAANPAVFRWSRRICRKAAGLAAKKATSRQTSEFPDEERNVAANPAMPLEMPQRRGERALFAASIPTLRQMRRILQEQT